MSTQAELLGALQNMTAVAQDGFASVAALARTACKAMNAAEPGSHGDLQVTLRTIASLADDCCNTIDVIAERQKGQP